MGETYTAEEYREVLKAILDMEFAERETAFGAGVTVFDYIKDFSASELIEKCRTYVNTPKVGEYWKNNEDGGMVVVWRVEEDTVFIYHCDGGHTDYLSFIFFVNNFTKTERKSQYLESFIKEVEKVSK